MKAHSTPTGDADLPFDTSILDGLSDPVILVDLSHVIVKYNRAARLLLGRNALGCKLEELLDSQQINEEISDRLKGKPGTTTEVFLPNPIGRYFDLNVWRLPELKSPGPAWAMLVLRDVTASRKVVQMRADFVANVSHELRSPLSSLLGFIETLQGPARDDPEATEHFLEIMEAEAQRMTRLINDLLALSKFETEEHIRPEQAIWIGPILSLVADTLSVRARERGMEINLEMQDSLPQVLGDSDELTQVFQNLISNAISYGRRDTTIRVEVTKGNTALAVDGPGITIAVINQGDGIPAEDIARVVGISPPTLRKYYRDELDTAMAKSNALVAESLFGLARKGNVVKLKDGDEWTDGWKVMLVGARMLHSEQAKIARGHEKHRPKVDI